MSGVAAGQTSTSGPTPAASAAATPVQGSAPPPPGASGTVSPAGDAKVHLYDAVATQRDRVLGSFDAQRSVILKAVADQRAAALAPIHAVQARLAGRTAAANPTPATATMSAVVWPQANLHRPQAVAAEIVATIKSLVAEEVRLQLQAVLRALCETRGTPDPATSPTSSNAADTGTRADKAAG